MKMKNLLLVIAFLGISFGAKAQAFDSAVGLRLGYPISVSYKTFINETSAAEAYVGFRSYFGSTWLSANAAYQIHNYLEFEGVENLQWYYGAGAGIHNLSSDFGGSTTFFSVQGYIGLSYTLENTPLNFSIDWSPSLFVGTGGGGLGGFGGRYGALSVRYVLGQS
jgi:hypothetical protein